MHTRATRIVTRMMAPWRTNPDPGSWIPELLPGRVNRLADQRRLIRAGPRSKFLEPARVNFRDIEVAFLVRAHAVDAPERARKIRHGSPRINQATIEVVLEHLVRVAIEGRDCAVGANLHE